MASPPGRVPEPPVPPLPRFPLARLALWAIPACLAFAVLEAWQGRVLVPHVEPGDFWRVALWRTLPSWITLALLVPLVPVWVLAWRSRRPGAWQWCVIHALGGTAFVFAHLGLAAVAVIWTPIPRTIAEEFRHFIGIYFTTELITYLAIAGLVHVTLALTEARAAERAALELRAELARAELARLRGQLDPHLLFNALNSVMALAERRDFDGVRHAVDRLAQLLRRSLGAHAQQEGPLDDELGFAADYLAIQQLRYGESLKVEFEIGPGAREARVPSLVLQPIVENAVRHGLSGSPRGDRVRILAERTATAVRIRVEDSGPGFRQDAGGTAGAGIGLENTRRRLEHLYGARHRMTLGNGEAGGAYVEIEIPQEAS